MSRALRLTVLADTHYYDASLGVTGNAYALRSASDQKCLAETDAILTAAFAKIAESDTNAVLIAGDLSNDGERVCHEKMREKLYVLQKTKPVFVTTATHDWCCDKNPRRFDGDKVSNDVETLSSEELYDFYADFGVKGARDTFKTHIGTASYLADLSDSVVLLSLIDDKNGRDHAGYTPDHLEWILNTVRRETAAGKTVIAMQHHLLYPHISPLVTNGCCCEDRDELREQLADAGLRFLFVGHSHIQRIDKFVSKTGRELYEINVGSLCGYPAPRVEVEITDTEVRLQTVLLDRFAYNGKTVDAQSYLEAHALHLIGGVLTTLAHGTKQEAADKLQSFGVSAADAKAFTGNGFPLLQNAARFILRARVKDAAALLRRFPGGKEIMQTDVEAMRNMPLTEIANAVLLSVLSGVPLAHSYPQSLCRVLCAAGNIPSAVLSVLRIDNEKLCALADELPHLLSEVCTGGALDNQNLTLERVQS
ncbi:MAG: metallophosphoesterase family protein [Candidatus Fimenecus sp.]